MERRLEEVTPEQLRMAQGFAVINCDDPDQFVLFSFRPAPLVMPGQPAPISPRLFEFMLPFSDGSQWKSLERLLEDAGELHEGSQRVINRAIADFVHD